MMRQTCAIVVLATATIVLAGACSGGAAAGQSPVVGQSGAAPTTATATTTGVLSTASGVGASSAGPAIGHVGDKLTFAKYGGDLVNATLLKIFDPATPKDPTEAPLPSKTHWVGAQVLVNNPIDYSGEGSSFDAETSARKAVTTTDTYEGGGYVLGDGFGCTQTDGNPQDTAQYTYCVAFPVPDRQTLAGLGIRTGGGRTRDGPGDGRPGDVDDPMTKSFESTPLRGAMRDTYGH
jgi:hypothetical protein